MNQEQAKERLTEPQFGVEIRCPRAVRSAAEKRPPGSRMHLGGANP